jgi:hypothetical protein
MMIFIVTTSNQDFTGSPYQYSKRKRRNSVLVGEREIMKRSGRIFSDRVRLLMTA